MKKMKKFIKRKKKEKNKRGGKTMSKNVGAVERERERESYYLAK